MKEGLMKKQDVFNWVNKNQLIWDKLPSGVSLNGVSYFKVEKLRKLFSPEIFRQMECDVVTYIPELK